MQIEKIQTNHVNLKMIEDFDDFVSFIVINRLNRGLRNQMMFYLTNQNVPFSDHKEFLEDLRFTYDFLDSIQDELTRHKDEIEE